MKSIALRLLEIFICIGLLAGNTQPGLANSRYNI